MMLAVYEPLKFTAFTTPLHYLQYHINMAKPNQTHGGEGVGLENGGVVSEVLELCILSPVGNSQWQSTLKWKEVSTWKNRCLAFWIVPIK